MTAKNSENENPYSQIPSDYRQQIEVAHGIGGFEEAQRVILAGHSADMQRPVKSAEYIIGVREMTALMLGYAATLGSSE